MTTAKKPTLEQRVAARFRLDVAKHQLTVLHDDGLYRHLRCLAPGDSSHWFDLITWPGTLTIKGDMGSYTFSRTQDMLDFFRRSAWGGGPNLQYWEEKLDAADRHAGVREYSEELLRQHIADDLAALAESGDVTADYLAGLHEELDDELLGELPTWCIEDEGEALAGVRQFEYRPGREEPFTFESTEWDVRDWAWHYVWCCHAIIWGIAAYDRAKAGKPAPALTAAATTEPDSQQEPVLVAAGATEETSR
ncbi:hypothetical protein ACFC1T_27330 [Kitasatospora sp. NPDC056076]|uniref:hypothetical protein n=1 Tax=Kitasatospora sp. NPDC056076 TaxID=3345703 RepID=UPI0035DD0BDF